MKTINLNDATNCKTVLFPDGQPHVQILNIDEGDDVRVIVSLTSAAKLLQLLMAANAIAHAFAKKKELVIPYLMAARYDRIMQPGDSFDLQVVAQLINSLQFEKVYLLDVHSYVSSALIHNCITISNEFLVKEYKREHSVLICPDAGAAKKVPAYLTLNPHLKDVVYCTKHRDLATGKLTLKVQEPEKCLNRNCIIIDDICDGGATFLAIAGQIAPKHLTLMVTHGIFSKGFTALEEKFDEIITSNSYYNTYNSSKVNTIAFPIPNDETQRQS